MVEIIVKDFLNSHITNADGDKLRLEIIKHFKNGDPVAVSLKDIYGLNSSFINSAFIDLLEDYTFDYIKNNLNFVNTNRQINRMILSRFRFEVNKMESVAYC